MLKAQGSAKTNEFENLTPAQAFKKLVEQHSHYVWSGGMDRKPRNAQEFLEGLAGNAAVPRLIGEQNALTLKEKGYGNYFDGKISPLNEQGDLTVDAAILMVILRMTTDRVEKAVPQLANRLVLVDTLRQAVRNDKSTAVCRNIADLLIAKKIFSLTQLRHAAGDSLTEDMEKALVPLLKQRDLAALLKTPEHRWVVGLMARIAGGQEQDLLTWRPANTFQTPSGVPLRVAEPS
jgi:hypothetical protein